MKSIPDTTRFSRFRAFISAHWFIASIVVITIVGVSWYFFGGTKITYQFVTVTQGSIVQTVSVTGNTTPLKSVSLGFQNTGTIARVNYRLGDYVNAGSVIAELGTGNLSAALQQAEAILSAAKANLSALTAGTRPEQLAIYQNAVTQGKTVLVNAVANAYTTSDSAIHMNVDQFFTNARNWNAALTFVIPDATLSNSVVNGRISLEPILTAWGMEVLSPAYDAKDPLILATQAVQYLTHISTFLNNVSAALTKAQVSTTLSLATLDGYRADITSARTSVANALTSITSAQTSLISAQGSLTLAEAGSTSQSIEAQNAQVEQAQAGVANALANLQNARIIAPMNGVITELDAKIGQLASPGTPMVSLVGNGGFEVDAGVSETDIGKLTIGNKVTMTLDAFPNETFTGSVFYIASAQTNTQGVISYQVKISFDKADLRLKSGLTANIDIQTKQVDDVLILPQYAILQDDNGTFVEILSNDLATTTPITLGIQDREGNVEILSGVTLGDNVINIGLKKQ